MTSSSNSSSEPGQSVDPPAWREVSELSFEEAQAELEQVVARLEDQHTGLDDAIALWERGEALHAWCQKKLDAAAARIEKLRLGDDEIEAVTAETEAFTDAAGDSGAVPHAPDVDAESAPPTAAPAGADAPPSMF